MTSELRMRNMKMTELPVTYSLFTNRNGNKASWIEIKVDNAFKTFIMEHNSAD